MKLVLNTRTLVGHDHTSAAEFAREYFDGFSAEIDWMQSPSARCVLELNPEDQELQIQLEQELRAHLGLPSFDGDDDSETERGATAAPSSSSGLAN